MCKHEQHNVCNVMHKVIFQAEAHVLGTSQGPRWHWHCRPYRRLFVYWDRAVNAWLFCFCRVLWRCVGSATVLENFARPAQGNLEAHARQVCCRSCPTKTVLPHVWIHPPHVDEVLCVEPSSAQGRTMFEESSESLMPCRRRCRHSLLDVQKYIDCCTVVVTCLGRHLEVGLDSAQRC